jgi:hypothetical protein
MTWTNKGKCSDLSGGNQADGNFRLLSNHYHLELAYSLRFKYGLAADGDANQVWNAGYNLLAISQDGQYGTNNCGTQMPGCVDQV